MTVYYQDDAVTLYHHCEVIAKRLAQGVLFGEGA